MTEVTFWVWNFEVIFTAVTAKMHHKDKVGTGRNEVRFRWVDQRGHQPIRALQDIDDMRGIEEALRWLQEYVNGVAAAIAMSQVDPFDHPSGLLGGATDIP